MKVGSIVECVNNANTNPNKPLELNKTYTIRAIRTVAYKKRFGLNSPCDGVLLEEIVNESVLKYQEERGYLITRFRELLPPIENIEEHINENTLEPVLK